MYFASFTALSSSLQLFCRVIFMHRLDPSSLWSSPASLTVVRLRYTWDGYVSQIWGQPLVTAAENAATYPFVNAFYYQTNISSYENQVEDCCTGAPVLLHQFLSGCYGKGSAVEHSALH